MRIGFMCGVAGNHAVRGPEIPARWPSGPHFETTFKTCELRMLIVTSMFTSAVEWVASILAEGRGRAHALAFARRVGCRSAAGGRVQLQAVGVSRPSAPMARVARARRGRLPDRRVAPPEDQNPV